MHLKGREPCLINREGSFNLEELARLQKTKKFGLRSPWQQRTHQCCVSHLAVSAALTIAYKPVIAANYYMLGLPWWSSG